MQKEKMRETICHLKNKQKLETAIDLLKISDVITIEII